MIGASKINRVLIRKALAGRIPSQLAQRASDLYYGHYQGLIPSGLNYFSASMVKAPVEFREIAQQHRAIFFNAHGVLRDVDGVIEGVPQALSDLKRSGIPFFVVSNSASARPSVTRKKLNSLGFDLGADQVFTSGGLLSDYLLDNLLMGKLVALTGGPGSFDLVRAAGAIPRLPSKLGSEIPTAIIIASRKGWDWELELNIILNLVKNNPGIKLILANPDKEVTKKDQVSGNQTVAEISPGLLALMIEDATKQRFIKLGKPYPELFQLAFGHARRRVPDLKPREVLMVGDTLHTDIVGGNRQGYHILLVLSGNTSPDRYRQDILEARVFPYAVSHSVAS